jgi:hypothetical protein
MEIKQSQSTVGSAIPTPEAASSSQTKTAQAHEGMSRGHSYSTALPKISDQTSLVSTKLLAKNPATSRRRITATGTESAKGRKFSTSTVPGSKSINGRQRTHTLGMSRMPKLPDLPGSGMSTMPKLPEIPARVNTENPIGKDITEPIAETVSTPIQESLAKDQTAAHDTAQKPITPNRSQRTGSARRKQDTEQKPITPKRSQSTSSARRRHTSAASGIRHRISSVNKADASQTTKVGAGIHLTFDLEAVTQAIGKYEMESERPGLSGTAEAKLHQGCEKSQEKRKEFLEKFHARMRDIPQKDNDTKPVTTMLELFGGDEELLELYHDAVAEERNSTEFRDAVFTKSAEKQDENPCPGQRLVMYVGGPSAAGKSFTRGAFVEKVKEMKKEEAEQSVSKNQNSETPLKDSYIVSVDGGIDREICQMRQIVLQSALAKGYAGIEDLQKNTNTSVKKHVKNAAMAEGNHMHVVIPATFISGFVGFVKMFNKLGNKNDVFQVFAEVRADKTGELKGKEATESFRQTIKYNGESRAYHLGKERPLKVQDIKMNNRELPCESKVYESKYFDHGVTFSKKAKAAFKKMASSKRSIILSNESDNMHVAKTDAGKYVQTTSNPTVKHVSRREVKLWEMIDPNKGTPVVDVAKINSILDEFGIPDGQMKEEAIQQMIDGDMSYHPKDKDESKTIKVEDLKTFIGFLASNGMRSRLKVTPQNI